MAHLRQKERYLIPFSDSLKKCLCAIENSRCETFKGKYNFRSDTVSKDILIRNVPSLSEPDGSDERIGHEDPQDKDTMEFFDIPWDQIKPRNQNDEEKFPNTEDFP